MAGWAAPGGGFKPCRAKVQTAAAARGAWLTRLVVRPAARRLPQVLADQGLLTACGSPQRPYTEPASAPGCCNGQGGLGGLGGAASFVSPASPTFQHPISSQPGGGGAGTWRSNPFWMAAVERWAGRQPWAYAADPPRPGLCCACHPVQGEDSQEIQWLFPMPAGPAPEPQPVQRQRQHHCGLRRPRRAQRCLRSRRRAGCTEPWWVGGLGLRRAV